MTRSEYYDEMRRLANEQRSLFNLSSVRVTLTDLRKIFKHHDISISLWPMPGISGDHMKKIKGAYMHVDGQPSVLISRRLPDEQRIFTMAHELKHHLADYDDAAKGITCQFEGATDAKEIAAEVFAAELIYPDTIFISDMSARSIAQGACTDRDIVRLKRSTNTTLSFTALAKKATFLGFASKGSLDGVKWKKLDEEIFGEPLYKRINRYRHYSGQ
jgi:hypothetical protein